ESALGEDAVRRLATAVGAPRSTTKLFAAARRGDPAAAGCVSTSAERIALAIATFVPVLDPALVVLGGSIGTQGDLLLEPIRRELERLSPFRPRIEVSALGEDAVVTGAVATALSEAQEQLFSRRSTG